MDQWEGNPHVQGAGQIRPAYRAYLERFAPVEGPGNYHGPSNTKAAVIIDDRWATDDLLPRVVGNFAHFLKPEWDLLQINLPQGNGSPAARLNRLLLSPRFWERDVAGYEHVLLFQRDTVCFQPLDPEFLEYDMIGAPCGRIKVRQTAGESAPFIGASVFDMNGGLSLRKRSAMLRALDQVPVPEGAMPEDVYFSRALQALDGVLPDLRTAMQFAVESQAFYYEHTFGVHGTDKHYLPDHLAEKLTRTAVLPEGVAL